MSRCESRMLGYRSDGAYGPIARCALDDDHEGLHRNSRRRWTDDGTPPSPEPRQPGRRSAAWRRSLSDGERIVFHLDTGMHERLCAEANRMVVSPAKLMELLVGSFLDSRDRERVG